MGGHKPKAISGEHRAWLLERAKARVFTLRGLVAELAERGLKVDYRAVWTRRREAELQKKPCWPASAIDPTWRTGGRSGESIKTASSLSVWYSSTRPGPGPT
jgi:putative transposase